MRTYCEAIVFNQRKFSVVFEIMRVMWKIGGGFMAGRDRF